MHPLVRDTIRELRLTQVARKMGLPISTVFRWMSQDRIPGKGRAHDWRVAQFETAVSELRAETSNAVATERAER